MIAQKIEVRIEPTIHVPEDFEEFFGKIAEAYYECDGVFDQDLSGDVSTGALTFSMGVEATDPGEAITQAVSVVRTVMHEVGAGTPRWEQHIDVALRSADEHTGPRRTGMIAA